MTTPPPAIPTTPCLIVNEQRMQANIERMAQGLRRHKVPLRPHLKTCKNIEIARRLMAGQPGHATVSTLAEADYFFAHGIDDLLYAVGIAPGKLAAVAERLAAGMNLTLVLDHVDTARAVGAAAQRLGCRFCLLLEIDCDGQRAGFQPQAEGLLEAAALLAKNGCQVAGVMVHAGGSYNCREIDCIRAIAERERLAAVTAAQRLRHAGHAALVVSVGSTPTATFAENLDGVSEVRAGVHVFHDLVMASLGVCNQDDIALSVLTEVIGHRADIGQAIIDAGWMALSRDRGLAGQGRDTGYGLVMGPRGADVIVRASNQEHGLIGHLDGTPLDLTQYPIGRRLHILPNHACATAGQHAGYWLQSQGDKAMRWLPRCSGW